MGDKTTFIVFYGLLAILVVVLALFGRDLFLLEVLAEKTQQVPASESSERESEPLGRPWLERRRDRSTYRRL